MAPSIIGQRLNQALDKLAYQNVSLQDQHAQFTVKAERPFFHRAVQWLRPQHAASQRLAHLQQFTAKVRTHYGESGVNEVKSGIYRKGAQGGGVENLKPLTKRNIRQLFARVQNRVGNPISRPLQSAAPMSAVQTHRPNLAILQHHRVASPLTQMAPHQRIAPPPMLRPRQPLPYQAQATMRMPTPNLSGLPPPEMARQQSRPDAPKPSWQKPFHAKFAEGKSIPTYYEGHSPSAPESGKPFYHVMELDRTWCGSQSLNTFFGGPLAHAEDLQAFDVKRTMSRTGLSESDARGIIGKEANTDPELLVDYTKSLVVAGSVDAKAMDMKCEFCPRISQNNKAQLEALKEKYNNFPGDRLMIKFSPPGYASHIFTLRRNQEGVWHFLDAYKPDQSSLKNLGDYMADLHTQSDLSVIHMEADVNLSNPTG